MKKVAVLIIIIFILASTGLAFTGLVPGLSSIFVKAKDLCLNPDPLLVDQVNKRANYQVILPNSNSQIVGEPIYTGQQPIDDSFTSQEVTSVLDSWSGQFSITPFYNVQVKLEGSSAEASGIIKIDKAIQMALSLGYTPTQIEQAKSYASFINGDVPFYLKGGVEVANNQVNPNISTIQIGKVNLPSSIADPVIAAATDAIERRIGMTPGLNVELLQIQDSQMNLKGTIPQSVQGN